MKPTLGAHPLRTYVSSVAAALLIVLIACHDGGGDAACSEYEAENSCFQCTYDNCCSELLACLDNPDCTLYSECLSGCSDQACEENCGASNPNGRSYFESYDSCVQAACGFECG